MGVNTALCRLFIDAPWLPSARAPNLNCQTLPESPFGLAYCPLFLADWVTIKGRDTRLPDLCEEIL